MKSTISLQVLVALINILLMGYYRKFTDLLRLNKGNAQGYPASYIRLHSIHPPAGRVGWKEQDAMMMNQQQNQQRNENAAKELQDYLMQLRTEFGQIDQSLTITNKLLQTGKNRWNDPTKNVFDFVHHGGNAWFVRPNLNKNVHHIFKYVCIFRLTEISLE